MSDFQDELRSIELGAFSEADEFKKDMQLIIDENYLNEFFLSLFHSQATYSLRDTLYAMLDDHTSLVHSAGKLALATFMSTGMWQKWLPTIREDFGARTLPMDIRCGFSKEFMRNLDAKYVT
jgi:hypothetical protein